MADPIISVSGLRGVVGAGLTPEVAARYACCFANGLSPGPVVVTRDGRTTGRMLSDVISGSLCATGRNVIDADVAATPTTGVLVRHHRATGGLQISASHNPPAYNGIKLFGADGRVISAAAGEAVLRQYQTGGIEWCGYDRIGVREIIPDRVTEHCQLVLDTIDSSSIRRKRFRVLLDSNHGAGSLLGKKLLETLECDVVLLGGQPDGRFEHPPEPTTENLKSVCHKVLDAEAHVGFCQDPDADRLALIDERGQAISEEYTLAICLDHVLRNRKGPVVTNCSSSRMSQDLAQKYGVPFYHSKVGEANVADVMLDHGAVFGGEGNGGPIDPRVGYVRDSFVGMAQVLDAMAARGVSLSQLVDELPRYAIHKTKVEIDAQTVVGRLTRLESRFPEAQSDRTDGLRFDWPEKWVLVRASNTEPIVRVIAEAKTAAESRALCEDVVEALT